LFAKAIKSIKNAFYSSDNYSKAGLIKSNFVIWGRHSLSIPTKSFPVKDRNYSQSDYFPIKFIFIWGGSLKHWFEEVGPNWSLGY